MFRIRFHGRGGQGVKTASRILGTAFFLSGYEVQDAPRYGAERRGAPMFGYVRADHSPILERGIINNPDLVVVADETLLTLPAAGVSVGLTANSILLVLTNHSAAEMRQQLPAATRLLVIDKTLLSHFQTSFPIDSCGCSAAAACLSGLSLEVFQKAMVMELDIQDHQKFRSEFLAVEDIFAKIGRKQQLFLDRREQSPTEPDSQVNWIDLYFEGVEKAAPAIHGGATSLHLKTGDWRTMRPVIDKEQCSRCRLCFTFCPDGVISLDKENYPVIDYEHCKGCLICLVQCPCRAIESQVEKVASEVNDA